MMSRTAETQAVIDSYYHARGPCCAGCDWWRWYNAVAGDCTRSAPVSSRERTAMLGFERSSLLPAAGPVMTPRDHLCGDFKDTYDWPLRRSKS